MIEGQMIVLAPGEEFDSKTADACCPCYSRMCSLAGAERSRHIQRAKCYAATSDKLRVEHGSALETQWGDLPTELLELISFHLPLRDIGRLRNVSSGWRAAFWQENVVRASLYGNGPRVDYGFLYAICSMSKPGRRAIFQQTELLCNDEVDIIGVLWEPVIDRMEPWIECVGEQTHSTVVNVCVTMLPFPDGSKQHAAELRALDLLRRTQIT